MFINVVSRSQISTLQDTNSSGSGSDVVELEKCRFTTENISDSIVTEGAKSTTNTTTERVMCDQVPENPPAHAGNMS